MMASSSELSLECKPQSYSMLLKLIGNHNPNDLATHNLEDYLNRLEEERLKIDAFKRELPLCMQLLTNAMEASKQQLQSYKSNQGTTTKPVLEEFIPLKIANTEGSDQKTANNSDKASWMTSAQLWSQTNDGKTLQITSNLSKNEAEIHNNNGFNNGNAKLGLSETNQINGGAFLPFVKDRCSIPKIVTRALPELALASSEDEKMTNESENAINNGSMSEPNGRVDNGNKVGNTQITATNSGATNSSQTHRKARRCWSPDLHRRFVNALQMLGGSQVATPKQIRELMKVDGLTNDEVKSHLQKYRLHTRRPSPSPQAAGAQAPQLVVLGGIWVPPEYATAAGGGATMYGAHPATSQVSPYIVPQEFYAPTPPQPAQPQLHHQALQQQQHHNHQLHVYKTSSHIQSHGSPESDARGAGDRSESIEDGKSESSSWKAESGGEDGSQEMKNLAALRDDREESNGSEITLKF